MDYDRVIHGRIVDPVTSVQEAYVGINGGIIRKVSGKELRSPDITTILQDHYIFPAFIDPHVHLREPGWEHKEDFLTGSEAALNGGVHTVLDMPNLPEPVTTPERLLRKVALARKAKVDVRHFAGVGNIDLIRENARLAVGYKIYTAKSTGGMMLDRENAEKACRIIAATGKPVTFHCEDEALFTQSEFHGDARPPESEVSAIVKAADLIRKTHVNGNIAHVSTKEGLAAVRESNLMHEITPHHLYFNRESAAGPLFKVNPPLRSRADSAALVDSVRRGECMLATDHAPHTMAEKLSSDPPSGMPGLDTYGNFVLWLLRAKYVSPAAAAKITSYNAARFFSIAGGRIAEGFPAKFTILGTEGETVIRNGDMKTKCGWTPFDGVTFPGKIIRL
ncbi:MAG: amidohydrolase family protein [Candidatus Aenigmarchaeota archaeon]|nr:amidohydrolase family protein [Candidatus Aenigmarchaeota archaeon]